MAAWVLVGLQAVMVVLAVWMLRIQRRNARQLINLVNAFRGHATIARSNFRTIFDRLDKRGGWWWTRI